MAAISWFLFSWLFASGEIARDHDRKTLHAKLKKARKKIAKLDQSKASYVYGKWTWFGGGFYGLAGLWTFVVIELRQLFGFIVDFPGWQSIQQAGLIGFFIEFLIGQLANMLQGLLWFAYWPSRSVLIWVLVAYLGYWAGVELARRQTDLPVQAGLRWLKPYWDKIRNLVR